MRSRSSSSATTAAQGGQRRQRRVAGHQPGRLRTGLRDDLLVPQHPQQPQGRVLAGLGDRRARRPPCAAAGRAARARSRRPSRRPRPAAPARASPWARRTRAGRAPACPPRPTRPRSWCSWDTPNRSASITTMTVAFGTSTPTSMTVVATSTSSSPAANRRITASLSSGVIRPCSTSTRRPDRAPSASCRCQVEHRDRRPPLRRPRRTRPSTSSATSASSSPMRGHTT